MICLFRHQGINMMDKIEIAMKKILLMIIGLGVLVTFYSCEDDEILPLPEYVAIQPASWTFGTIAMANPTFSYEFKLTTFQPQSYSISVLQMDVNNWITGSTEIFSADISGEQPNATITGTLNTSDVFTNVAVGETAMLRLTLTSAQGNTNVAIPWQTVEITE